MRCKRRAASSHGRRPGRAFRAAGNAARVACAVAVLAAYPGAGEGAGAGGEGTPRMDGPFNVLEWADGVSTSRSGYAVWVRVPSREFRAALPGHESEIGHPEHGASLFVNCRAAGGGARSRFGSTPAFGGIYLDDHPDQPGAYTVIHPMYWILELSERHLERWPVEVRIGDNPAVASALVRRLTDYSAPHPGLDIALPGGLVIDAVSAGVPIEVEVRGPQVRLVGRFTASDNARRAAALMRTACP